MSSNHANLNNWHPSSSLVQLCTVLNLIWGSVTYYTATVARAELSIPKIEATRRDKYIYIIFWGWLWLNRSRKTKDNETIIERFLLTLLKRFYKRLHHKRDRNPATGHADARKEEGNIGKGRWRHTRAFARARARDFGVLYVRPAQCCLF